MPHYNPHWVIRIGATFIERLQIQTPDDDNVLQVVDITGATFTCKLRENRDDGTVVATPSVSIDTASTGKISIKIEEATTANLTAGSGVWGLEMTLDNDVKHIAEGKYTIVQRISR